MSPAGPSLTRRRVIGLAVGTLLLAGCGGEVAAPGVPPGEPDPLLALSDAARADAAAATAAAIALPAQAASLGAVATLRRAHAEALRAEMDRAAGATVEATPVSTGNNPAASTPAPAPPVSQVPPPAPPTAGEVTAALGAAAVAARELAITQPSYRAGLLGSVAAACTASQGALG